MKTLLVIDSSGRRTRSITRHLTARFAAGWSALYPSAEILSRDVGLTPPPPVNEKWIAAAFSDPAAHTKEMAEALALSETFIDEITQAQAIVIGAPVYNFGLPAQLKAYIDQIVRAGRTFAFDPTDAASPYRPLLTPKPVVIITAAGDGSMHPGGAMAHLNFLEPHLATVLGFIGLSDPMFIRVGYEEFQDDRLKRSLAAAETKVDEAVQEISQYALMPQAA